MKDIVLTLRETDPQGNVATSHEFQVSNETIEGFGGTLEGPWTLDAKKTGKAYNTLHSDKICSTL